MKQNVLRVIALSLLVSTAFVILTRLTNANAARDQNSRATNGPTASPEKTAEQVFKNIKVLNGLPQSEFYPVMRFMAASLGTQCGFCHVFKDGQLDSAADDKPEKQTARVMIKMVREINKTIAQSNPTVSCYTCHRGRTSPQGGPTLPEPLPSPSTFAGSATQEVSAWTEANSTSVLPSADEILNKYITALGGGTAVDQVRSCVIKGITATASGKFVPYEAEQMIPDQAHEIFTIQNVTYERVINGPRGWLKNYSGVADLMGQRLAEQKLSFPLFMILRLKEQYASLLVSAPDKIDGRDVYVLSAIRPDNKRERLYFDVESGLLRRRVSYIPTMVGTIPQQTDFEDYRKVGGLRLPFTIQGYVDANSPIIIRKFTEIKFNTPVDGSKFNQPLPTKPKLP
jgi:hypothetical protein